MDRPIAAVGRREASPVISQQIGLERGRRGSGPNERTGFCFRFSSFSIFEDAVSVESNTGVEREKGIEEEEEKEGTLGEFLTLLSDLTDFPNSTFALI